MVMAIVVSLLSGVTIVVSRTLNAELAKETSSTVSTLYNYVIGLLTSLAIFGGLVLWRGFDGFSASEASPWMYTGGLVGVIVVFMLNVVVHKISSFYVTLTLFIAQVFMGILLDLWLTQEFSLGTLIGGIAVAIGLSINLAIDKSEDKSTP